ncbi:hypothetical protein [Halobacillus naozhouensis]|uniref:Uncharacterized protein n=1 Tax=Halobacillus naozhouensis TaxID=554880 RepID=A0ABY8J0E5_9BACI|nr:hypothetical protein [Halobacillus naozhouensis]WFT74888.1 hypothetical protein P9989_00160 [Halobacillus naozhouensis]
MEQHIEKAREIESSVNKKYIEIREEAAREISLAKTDTDLSPEGRRKKAQKLREKYALKTIEFAKEIKKEFQSEVSKAQAESEKLLKKEAKKPNDENLRQFESQLNDLKTRLMLSTDPGKSEKQLAQFVDGIKDEPYFAGRLKEEFSSVINPILSSAPDSQSTLKLKKSLDNTFDYINNQSLSHEQREAKEINELSKQLYESKLFSPVALTNAEELFGKEFTGYLNDPDSLPEDVVIDAETGRMGV